MSSNFQFHTVFGKMTKPIIATIILCVFLGSPLIISAAEIFKVNASAYQAPNAPENTTDSNFNTRWSAEGNGQWIDFDLGSIKKLNGITVGIAFLKGDRRTAKFDILASKDGLEYFTVCKNKRSKGKSLKLEHFFSRPDWCNKDVRYVRIIGYGNSDSSWNSYTEVSIAIDEVAVRASSFQEPNAPKNTIDSNLSTRWSAKGNGQWIDFDIGENKKLYGVSITFLDGNKRTAEFDIAMSNDGSSYHTVLTNQISNGNSLDPEEFNFDQWGPYYTRYVRIIGHGNSDSSWNSYTEINFDYVTDSDKSEDF